MGTLVKNVYLQLPESIARRVAIAPGCPTSLDDLAYLRVRHFGYDGAVHEGELVVKRELAVEVSEIFEELLDARFPIEKVNLIDVYGGDDEASMSDNNTSCFNARVNVTSPERWSLHARGRAIDVNPRVNPYARPKTPASLVLPKMSAPYLDRGRPEKGLIREGDACHSAFLRRGWTWGGSWQDRVDYQHFEKPE